MAIEKTTFTATTLTDRQTEVYNWLSENATDYFETITNDTEHSKIICTFAGCETAKTEFYFDYNTMASLFLENGTKYASSCYTDSHIYYKVCEAIKTSYGIYLGSEENIMTSSSPYQGALIISKNNDNTTCVSLSYDGFLRDDMRRDIICPEKSKVLTVTSQVLTADMTTFAPIPIAEGVYPENMFFTPFSSARYVGVITDDNGQKYFYDGYCAIKE